MNIEALVMRTIADNRLTFEKYHSNRNIEFMARLGAVIDFDMRFEESIAKKDAKTYSIYRKARDLAKSFHLEYSLKVDEAIRLKKD